MDSTKFESYLKDRYAGEIAWYETRSTTNKRFYVLLQWMVIILSAVIPVLTLYLEEPGKYLAAGLGVVLAIGTTGLKTFKLQENWLNYRSIAEALKKEKHYYDAGVDGYERAHDRESFFVQRVEALISRENSLWIEVQTREKSDDRDK